MSSLKSDRVSKKEKPINSEQNSKEESVRMNVNVPKSFYKHIKQKALNQDITIKELVLKALKEYIDK